MMQKKFIWGLALALTLSCGTLAAPAVSAEESSTEESSSADTDTASETEVVDADAEEEEEEYTSGDFTYTLTDSDTVSISGYTGSDTALVVPDTLDGKTVTELGGGAFAGQSSITEITLPKTLETVNDSCFYGCAALETFKVEDGSETFSVEDGVLFSEDGRDLICFPYARTDTTYTVPASVEEIWSSAFANTQLTSVTFQEGLLYIDDWAFAYTPLESLELPDSLLEIGTDAFIYCNGLTEVTFPSNLETIEPEAFAACENLAEITLPDSLTTVGMSAFAGTAMKSVTIPSSVTYIGFSAFGYEADTVTAVEDFVIYGEVGSEAQAYCTKEDEENDYANNFTFSSVISEDTTEGEQTVQVEQEETGFFKQYGKWILMGAGLLVLLVAGVILLVTGAGKGKKDAAAEKQAAETPAESEEPEQDSKPEQEEQEPTQEPKS